MRYACSLLLTISLFTVSARGAVISIDGNSSGRVFDGVGAISGGGGNTRLLFDYTDPVRTQILNYLFKPNYGASLQILKVEIGSDCDSTDGAEPSHMRERGEENYGRGYEWWLMEQAKIRQPAITLAALPWGAPAWVGEGKNYFSQDLIDYLIKWLKHAQSDHHLTIDYIGGRNEKGYDCAWYKKFKTALQAQGLSSIRVVASDDWHPGRIWAVATDMKKDPALDTAIDIVGGHTPHEDGYPTADALSLNKPLWASEDHFDQDAMCKVIARSLNRNYIDGKITATIYWPAVSAIYDNLMYSYAGLIKCNQPWSGNYQLSPSLWILAHTTQFTHPGWHYLDSACGYFANDRSGSHGSYVTFADASDANYSVVIETVDAITSSTANFSLSHVPVKALHVWATNLNSKNPRDWFVRQADLIPGDGHVSLTLQPGCVYSLTTTAGQAKGDAGPPPPAPFPLPYADDFNGPPGHLGRYFSDIYGSFETAPCSGGRSGFCLRQTTLLAPIPWKKTGNLPFTIIGNLKWTDYRVSSDVLLEKPGAIALLARLTGLSYQDTPNAYILRAADTGSWAILKSTSKNKESVLASGTTKPLGTNVWHRLGLTCRGSSLTAEIDGNVVGSASDAGFKAGMAGLGSYQYLPAQFSNFRVDASP